MVTWESKLHTHAVTNGDLKGPHPNLSLVTAVVLYRIQFLSESVGLILYIVSNNYIKIISYYNNLPKLFIDEKYYFGLDVPWSSVKQSYF